MQLICYSEIHAGLASKLVQINSELAVTIEFEIDLPDLPSFGRCCCDLEWRIKAASGPPWQRMIIFGYYQ